MNTGPSSTVDPPPTALPSWPLRRHRVPLWFIHGPSPFDSPFNRPSIKYLNQVPNHPSVLWCYKKELGFSTHRKKHIEKIKRDKKRGLKSNTGTASSAARAAEADATDSFELFIGNTDSRYAPRPWNYARRAGAAGLRGADAQPRREDRRDGAGRRARHPPAAHGQEFAATVRDEHGRPLTLQTESSGDVVPRFNERFVLSLGKCPSCLVCDDELNILPLCYTSHMER